MSFIKVENVVICSGGMSAEVAFSKYVANTCGLVYGGWELIPVTATPTFIIDRVNYVINVIKKIEQPGKPVLTSPGFLSVPYITTLCNWTFLPSQFLVSVGSILELKEMLRVSSEYGFKCYAVAGYDNCLPNGIVAWIKFIELPPPYLNYLTEFNVPLVIVMAVWDRLGKTFGENIARSYDKTNKVLSSGDIYLLYVNECYGNRLIDDCMFTKLLTDYNPELVSREPVQYISDWESGIDVLTSIASNFGNVLHVSASDSLPLYNVAYHLARQFMHLNGTTPKGIVLNEYMVSNPMYEMYYGYLPFLYWQGNTPKSIRKQLYDLIPVNEYQEIWLTGCRPLDSYTSWVPEKSVTIVLDESTLQPNLASWIQAHQPKEYPQFHYIDQHLFQLVCKAANLNVF